MKKVQKSFVQKMMMAVLVLCLFVSLVGCGAATFDKAAMDTVHVTESTTAGNSGGFQSNTKYEYAEEEVADTASESENGKVDISAADAKVKTLVIPTNEELMIAIDTKSIVENM